MSYILDALRKSEQERQRGKVPDFHSNPASITDESGRKLNIWAIVAVGVVLINVVLAVVFWNRLVPGGDVDAAKPVLTETAVPESKPEEKPVASSQPQSPVSAPSEQHASQAQPATVMSGAQGKKPDNTGTYGVEREQPEAGYETIRPRNSVANEEYASDPPLDSAVPQMDYVPQIEELSSFERQNIPDMTFSSHMYSSVPKYRSVIINGKRVKEGQRYNGDIVVREITESGVVMSQGSILFQVDVLGRWAQ